MKAGKWTMLATVLVGFFLCGCKSQNSEDTKKAIKSESGEPSLRWLARHQSANGGWGASSFIDNCVGVKCSGPGAEEFSIGVSSLALLAFLERGYTNFSRDECYDKIADKSFKYGEIVKKAIQYLISQQDTEGCIGKVGQKYMYNHAIASLGLAEAYCMTGEKQFREPTQKAINYLLEAQNRGKGENDRRAWRYSYRCGENDTSILGWCVLALKSAEDAGLFSGKGSPAYAGAIGWIIKDVTDEDESYKVGYMTKKGDRDPSCLSDVYAKHDTMTAIGVLTRILIEKNRNDPAVKGSVKRLLMEYNLPKWDNSGAEKHIDYCYWYWGTLALLKYDAWYGPAWKEWRKHLNKAILSNRHSSKDRCLNGSWDPEVDEWGGEGGRVYATAINAITLFKANIRYDIDPEQTILK